MAEQPVRHLPSFESEHPPSSGRLSNSRKMRPKNAVIKFATEAVDSLTSSSSAFFDRRGSPPSCSSSPKPFEIASAGSCSRNTPLALEDTGFDGVATPLAYAPFRLVSVKSPNLTYCAASPMNARVHSYVVGQRSKHDTDGELTVFCGSFCTYFSNFHTTGRIATHEVDPG